MIPPRPNRLTMLGLLASAAFLTTANAKKAVKVNKKFDFDEGIEIEFTYPNNYVPKNRDWVGIFIDDKPDLPLTEYPESGSNLSFYLRICNQSSAPCPMSDDELPKTGKLTFDVTDPNEDYWQQWPLPLGSYRTCLVDDGGSDNNSSGNYKVVGSCVKFKVKKSKKSKTMVKKSRVKVLKEKFDFEETISVSFKNFHQITNAWVGIYNYDVNLVVGDSEVDNPLMWVYTGCNNVIGDQETNNDCAEKKKKGKVKFTEDNTGRGWPLPRGKYMVMFSCDNNSPHTNVRFNYNPFEIV